MLTIKECQKYLSTEEFDDSQIEEIRNYLYSICKNIISKNIENYEKDIRKTNRGK
jgi:hypothetical protein